MAASTGLTEDPTNKVILSKAQRASVFKRAWEDAEFRKALETNPTSAIIEHLKIAIPRRDVAELNRRVRAALKPGLTVEHMHPPSCC
jgi:hypothetical protein